MNDGLVQHTYQLLQQLPLPPAQRAAVVAFLCEAAGQPPPPSDDLPPAEALVPVLCQPGFPTVLQAALEAVVGQKADIPPHRFPHPLGDSAPAPPQVVEALGLLGGMVRGVPRPLAGFPYGEHILHFQEAFRRPRPDRALILGGGYVGTEMALVWADAGSDVTLFDRKLEILTGFIPGQSDTIEAMLRSAGVTLRLGMHGRQEFQSGFLVSGEGRGGGVVARLRCPAPLPLPQETGFRSLADELLGRLSTGERVDLPSGVTRETLETYRGYAVRAIDEGKDTLGVQVQRRDAIDLLLEQGSR